MRETLLHPDAAIALRRVRMPEHAAVRDGVTAARELSAAVARLLATASPA